MERSSDRVLPAAAEGNTGRAGVETCGSPPKPGTAASDRPTTRMSDLELLCRVAAYLAELLFPRPWAPGRSPSWPCRIGRRIHLRLLSVIDRPTGADRAPGAVARPRRPAARPAALFRGQPACPASPPSISCAPAGRSARSSGCCGARLRLWVVAPACGLGWLGAGFLLFLAGRFLVLSEDIDALSLHGPMIVEWVQSGRVALQSHWNYPQCWEYQFVPGFPCCAATCSRSCPACWPSAALLLAVRALAARAAAAGPRRPSCWPSSPAA